MAGRLNKVQLIGNLTRDPEIRYVDNTTPVVRFGIAVNRKTKKKDETLFIDIVAWERLAETVNTYLKKGMSVFAEGRLVIRDFEKDGEKRRAVEVIAVDVQMLERSKAETNGGVPQPVGAPTNSHEDEDEFLDDELAF